MRFRKTLLLAICFLILAAGYYTFEVRLHSERVKGEKQKKLIFPFQAEEIEEIRVIRQEGPLHLKKERDRWSLLEPVAAKADRTVVDGIIGTLVMAETQRIIEEDPKDLKPYGLDHPSLRLEIRAKDKEPAILIFGEKNPTEAFYYAKSGENPKVFLVFNRLWNDVNREPFSLRAKTFVSLVPDKVEKVAIEYKGNHFELEKDDRGAWRITIPIETAGDEDEITNLLHRIRRTKVKTFLDNPEEPLSHYGLEPSAARLSWWIQGKATTILIGKKKEGKKLVYAKLPDTKTVVLVDEEIRSKLPEDLYALRDKRLLAIDRQRVKKIEWDYGDQRIVCEKKGVDLWEISEPTHLRADFFAVNDVLWTLSDGRIDRFYDQHPEELKGDEFDGISLRLGFWEEGEKEGKWLILGKENREKDGVFVRIGGANEVYLAGSKLKDEISKGVFDLRDKRLLSFEKKEIVRLEVKTTEKKYDLKRSGEKWKLLEPRKGKGDPRKVNALLVSIGLVKFKAILEERYSSLGPYGLDKAAMEIQLWTDKGDQLGPLHIGMEVQKKRGILYGRVGQKTHIYWIDAKDIDQIKKELEELVESS